MKFKVRKIEDSDWSTLVSWWKSWGWPAAPEKDFLPNNGKGGFLILDQKDNTPICAGFIWISIASVTAHINFIVSNKEYRKKPQRTDAITFLIAMLEEFAKKQGMKYIYTNSNSTHLQKRFEGFGYGYGSKTIDQVKKL